MQQAVNREQTVEETLAHHRRLPRIGFRSVNVDLIYGLPRQTLEGFGRTLDTVIAARPDRMAVYGYAHMPQIFKAQRQIDEAELPAPEAKLALLQLAIERLTRAPATATSAWTISRCRTTTSPWRRAAAACTAISWATPRMPNSDLIGLGVSAISHIGDSFSQNRATCRPGKSPWTKAGCRCWRGLRSARRPACVPTSSSSSCARRHRRCAPLERRHGIEFDEYFAEALARLRPLAADGLVRIEPDRIVATSRGRLLLRNIAMCFDRYLDSAALRRPILARHLSRARRRP